ncbi:MAG: type I-E CRISPR-associated protein Cas5/CasD [Desulfomonile sp.]
MSANTLFLRLEGALQAWGVQESKFVIRRTAWAPTKSGVIGMLCAALGVPRPLADNEWLPKLNALRMGVRIDRAGVRWWDYHTVGARMQMRIAEGEGKSKPGAMLTRREYLCDASFLVAVQGEQRLIEEMDAGIRKPKWTLYLGRKACPPSRPLLEHPAAGFSDLESALKSVPWRPRLKGDQTPRLLDCLLDWEPTPAQPEAPVDALVWYDVPLTFEPPAHGPRFVIRKGLRVRPDGEVSVAAKPVQNLTPPTSRPRADYRNSEFKKIRAERLNSDYHLCVFCKSPGTTAQHVTYRHAGGTERVDELRTLCRLCHDAVTMIEYGMGMGLDRIDPCEPRWRDTIIQKRSKIVKYRSLETRRRRLQPKEVE